MRIAREDKVLNAQCLILPDAVGNLLRIADQRRSCTAAHQADACPEIGTNAQALTRPLMQGTHPRLTGGVHAGKDLLRGGDSLFIQMRNQSIGGRPGFLFRFTYNDM